MHLSKYRIYSSNPPPVTSMQVVSGTYQSYKVRVIAIKSSACKHYYIQIPTPTVFHQVPYPKRLVV